jgi:hypothetical protein
MEIAIRGSGSPAGALPRRAWYVALFAVAGCYNIAWSLYCAAHAKWLFGLANILMPDNPLLFAGIAMVLGLFGVFYFRAAISPERGFVTAAVALLGKVLGPMGIAELILCHVWTLSTVTFAVLNDCVWLPLLALYLHDAWPIFERELASAELGQS